MLQPPMPSDEEARLLSLRSLGVLDTPPEERFDRITRLAMLAIDAPIALVSLVDANRQWFKSCHGLDVNETGRDISFCGHTILSAEPLIVENALEDERFSDNPLVSGGPGIRFYAGFPLSDREGHRLGTLCLIDRTARQLTTDQRRLLSELASMAETELVTIAREEALLRLDAIHRRLEATTEAIDEGLITTDWSGRIVAVNRAAEVIFGSSRQELTEQHLSELLPDEWKSRLEGESADGVVAAIGPGVEPGGRVVLATHDADGYVRFSVSDDGRGIPSDKLESIFARFQQVEASDARARRGTGLGLAICKQIVEQHGGSIHAESELASGSSFIFTITVGTPPPLVTDARPSVGHEARQEVAAP